MKIGEAVDGFGELAARQVTIHEWRVLSWRNDSTTAYKVNVRNLTCGCPDQRMNNDDDAVCAHLAAALHAADQRMDVGTALNFNLVERQRDLEKIADRLEQTATSVEAEAAHISSNVDEEGVETDTEPAEDDPVSATLDWLESHGLPSSKVKVWDDNGSIQIETTQQLDDDEFAVLRETDWIWYDGDEGRNYIKEDNLSQGVLS